MSGDLFNFSATSKNNFTVDLDNAAVWLKTVCLTKGKEATLSIAVENQLSLQKTADKKFVVAILKDGKQYSQSINLKLDSEKAVFTVEGDGTVEVTGLKQSFMSDSEDEEDCPELMEVPALKKRKTQESSVTEEKKEDKKESKEAEDDKNRKEIMEKKRQAELEAKKEEVEAERKAAEEAKQKEIAQKQAEKKKQQLKQQLKQQQREAEKQKQMELEKKKAEEKKKALEAAKEVEKKKNKDSAISIKKNVSGVGIEIFKRGSGQTAKPGRTVKVAYDGRLASNGKRFDKGTIDFKLGMGMVIQGWDIGVKDMQVGEKRKLLIPANKGYGARGAPPSIPKNAALVFDVELLAIK